MKVTVFLRTTLFIAAAFALTATISIGQTTTAKTKDGKKADAVKATPKVPTPPPTSEKADDVQAETPATGDDVTPYYVNYLKEYRLGPSDIISVEVFGQCPDYCVMSKTVPPNAKIAYPLIREGILVAGKTVEQVAAEITAKLDEFIIDPKVNVTLEKAMSTRYAVMGDVAAPGVRVMDRKVSVYEAILESGGVTKNANKDKVFIVSYAKDGKLSRKQVSLKQMEAGKAEMVFLSPGDQVFVEGKGFTIGKFLAAIGQASAARALFGSPF